MARRPARKSTQGPQARYDAAGAGRRLASWNPPGTGPNKAMQGAEKVRDRARDSVRNDWAAASIVQKWATNLVGVGITPRWPDAALTDLWEEFVPLADADGVSTAYGLQALGVRTWFDGGEAFLRRRPRAPNLPLPVPVQVQLIESDYCPRFDADQWPGVPVGNVIREGIEINKYGRRVAFHFYREHPGDKPKTLDHTQLVRVDARDVRHIFEPKRPGQMRGISELATMLVRLRNVADLEDAVLERQKLANLFVAFITRAMPDVEDIEFDPDTGLPKFYDKDGSPVARLEPGLMQELLPGEAVTFANPPEAGTNYPEYLRSAHLGNAAAGGMPYEIMSGDIANVSDRTLRVVINEFRRLARQRQWHTLIPMLCQPMVDWMAEAAVLNGRIPLSSLAAAKKVKWSPEGWEYIHPVQDAEGKAKLIEIGAISRDAVIGERGDDPATVDKERAEGKAREKSMGLDEPPPVAAPAPAPGRKPAPTPKALAGLVRLLQQYDLDEIQQALDAHAAGD